MIVGWSLSRGVVVVVVAEGLTACVAVVRRESGLPVSMGHRLAAV